VVYGARESEGDLLLALGDVAVGEWSDRPVVTPAKLSLRLATHGARVIFDATPLELRTNCVEPAGAGWLFTPCASDLLPLVMQELAEPNVWELEERGVLEGIPTRFMEEGVSLELGAFRAQTSGAPPQVTLSVAARIRATRR